MAHKPKKYANYVKHTIEGKHKDASGAASSTGGIKLVVWKKKKRG